MNWMKYIMIELCDNCLQKITGKEFDEYGWNTEKIMQGSSHTLMIYISNLVLRGEVARLKGEEKMSIVDEWAGEVTIQKYLKEIKDLLIKLNKDVTKLKSVICDESSDDHWDYWGTNDDEEEE